MKKLICIILCAAALCALWLPVSAAHVSAAEAIGTLEALGLVQGTGSGFEADRGATRAEAAVMLLRLLGQEQTALRSGEPCPFTDGGWASAHLGYMSAAGLVRGRGAEYFGAAETVCVRDYLTMALRALGYSEEAGDFTWERSISFADSVGLTHGEYTAGSRFLREDMALISYTALTLPLKGSSETLIRRLYLDGAVSAGALKSTRLVSALSQGETEYSPEELYERTSSSVFLVKVYEDEDTFRRDDPFADGSGFFVTGDGVAVLAWHELENCSYARAVTTDGREYDLTGVLFYDPLRDTAVVRISRTDTEGRTVRFFPHLDLGDSDLVYHGETLYAVGSPLGMTDCISCGMVSNPSRVVDDPAYPCIYFSTPISTGSSGGPLLNARGEVVGIVFGTFVAGQNLNIGTPINAIADAPLTGSGTPLAQVREAEDDKWAQTEFTLSRTELTLGKDQVEKIMVSHNGPSMASISYEVKERGVVKCRWGEFQTKRSVPIYVSAIGGGEADIEVRFAVGEGNPDTVAVIHVTVIGDPVEEKDLLEQDLME